ncbi:MAG: hypothetical protein QOH60_4729 [Mycobacterium sp.]|jgi:uncharacterized membrane protein YraQ (UPF0718 family)|nr:hypothetical protein [Mycobacterium sp.]
MRNAWRVFAFDIAAPLVGMAALVTIGYVLAWNVWWVAACAVLCTLIVEGMVVNVVLFRRDRVTVGTDDDGPGLRLAVVALTTAATVAAVLVAYTQWTVQDREVNRDIDEVVHKAVKFAESTMTYSPAEPVAAIDRAADMMDPEDAKKLKAAYEPEMKKQAAQNISSQAQTISAGLNPPISADTAIVAVVMRATRQQPGKPQEQAVVGFEVALTKRGDQWLVANLIPLSPAPPAPQ